MGDPSVFIADSSEEFRSALVDSLQTRFRVRACGNGKEALSLLTREQPDILIADLMLPELDGLSLLHRLAASGSLPITLATTRLVTDYVIDEAARLGVAYLMVKPCDIRAVVSRVSDLYARSTLCTANVSDTQACVSDLLMRLGVSPKLRGCAYLREAILRAVDNPMQSVTKELYPGIARQFGCNSAQVERSIRSAIQSAWSLRSGSAWPQIFPPDSRGIIPRPSNAVFISRLADWVHLEIMRFPRSK